MNLDTLSFKSNFIFDPLRSQTLFDKVVVEQNEMWTNCSQYKELDLGIQSLPSRIKIGFMPPGFKIFMVEMPSIPGKI